MSDTTNQVSQNEIKDAPPKKKASLWPLLLMVGAFYLSLILMFIIVGIAIALNR